MKTVCELNKCSGCMACADLCPQKAIIIDNDLVAYNAIIKEDDCIECGVCQSVCQNNNPAEKRKPIVWYQGWAKDEEIRECASSGGLATAIASAFVKNGGVVCSCVFSKGEFIFRVADNIDELKKFKGSKYVKSNPKGIYKRIRGLLRDNKKVLFIGLPCQVAALVNAIDEKLRQGLYTVDLICHGTPSPEILNIFLKQYGKSLDSLSDIQFRVKAKMQLLGDYKGIITKGVCDKYTIAFLNSLIYTENCYDCDYAKIERVSDITLGDSWGSELPMDTQKKGVSLVLCQTQKGLEIINQAELHMEAVDLENAVKNNHQLKRPSVMPKGRNEFFAAIKKGKNFNNLVVKLFPKQCIRQDIKEVLIKLKIIRRTGK